MIFDGAIHLDSFTDQSSRNATALKQRLQESDMLGCKLCMSEDRQYLAIGFENGTIQVWGTDSRHCIASLVLGDSRIATASFTSDGTIAAIGAGGKQIQIWDIVQGRCIKTLFFTHRVSCVRFLANDAFLECQFSDGTYRRVNMETWDIGTTIHQPEEPFVSQKLLQSLEGREYSRIESASGGNAIVLMNNGAAFTWDEKRRKLNFCKGHKSNVTAIAICRSDTRFAASYSPERYYSKKDDRHRRDKLNGKQLVRVRIIKTGQCQWRLPTDGKTIKKLQFFTKNRIILAGIARNDDILLWELTDTIVHGQERGRWDTIEIVRKNQGEPLECAVMSNPKTFVSAYSDGNIVKRPFSVQGEEDGIIKTFPGINAGVFEWEHLNCSDEIKKVLRGYQQP